MERTNKQTYRELILGEFSDPVYMMNRFGLFNEISDCVIRTFFCFICLFFYMLCNATYEKVFQLGLNRSFSDAQNKFLTLCLIVRVRFCLDVLSFIFYSHKKFHYSSNCQRLVFSSGSYETKSDSIMKIQLSLQAIVLFMGFTAQVQESNEHQI